MVVPVLRVLQNIFQLTLKGRQPQQTK